jgi:hypothetical protein
MGKGRNRLGVTLEATALTKHFVSLSLNIRIEAVFVLCIVNRIVTKAKAWFLNALLLRQKVETSFAAVHF